MGAGCRTGKQEPHTMMLDKNTDQPLQKIPLVLLSVNTLFFPTCSPPILQKSREPLLIGRKRPVFSSAFQSTRTESPPSA